MTAGLEPAIPRPGISDRTFRSPSIASPLRHRAVTAHQIEASLALFCYPGAYSLLRTAVTNPPSAASCAIRSDDGNSQ